MTWNISIYIEYNVKTNFMEIELTFQRAQVLQKKNYQSYVCAKEAVEQCNKIVQAASWSIYDFRVFYLCTLVKWTLLIYIHTHIQFNWDNLLPRLCISMCIVKNSIKYLMENEMVIEILHRIGIHSITQVK